MKHSFLRPASFLLLTLLTGCSSAELSEFQKQLSGLNTAMGPVYHQAALPVDREKVSNEATVPVDVDTAAARLKRYYRFTSDQEISALRSKGTTSGKWVATAMAQNSDWSSQPGAYYRMGRVWGDDDYLTIEVMKNGAKSDITTTFGSAIPEHLDDKYLAKLREQIVDVALGTRK